MRKDIFQDTGIKQYKLMHDLLGELGCGNPVYDKFGRLVAQELAGGSEVFQFWRDDGIKIISFIRDSVDGNYFKNSVLISAVNDENRGVIYTINFSKYYIGVSSIILKFNYNYKIELPNKIVDIIPKEYWLNFFKNLYPIYPLYSGEYNDLPSENINISFKLNKFGCKNKISWYCNERHVADIQYFLEKDKCNFASFDFFDPLFRSNILNLSYEFSKEKIVKTTECYNNIEGIPPDVKITTLKSDLGLKLYKKIAFNDKSWELKYSYDNPDKINSKYKVEFLNYGVVNHLYSKKFPYLLDTSDIGRSRLWLSW
ncbi:MAG: hypothetical protein R2784_21305 [Saprospiraceae bacterium]